MSVLLSSKNWTGSLIFIKLKDYRLGMIVSQTEGEGISEGGFLYHVQLERELESTILNPWNLMDTWEVQEGKAAVLCERCTEILTIVALNDQESAVCKERMLGSHYT